MEFFTCRIDGGDYVGRVICDELGIFHTLVSLPEGPDAWLPVLGSRIRYDGVLVDPEDGFLDKIVVLFGFSWSEALQADNGDFENLGTVTARMRPQRRREIEEATLEDCLHHREQVMGCFKGEFLYAQMTGSNVLAVRN